MRRTTLYDDGCPLLPHLGFENTTLLHCVPRPPPKLSTFLHSHNLPPPASIVVSRNAGGPGIAQILCGYP